MAVEAAAVSVSTVIPRTEAKTTRPLVTEAAAGAGELVTLCPLLNRPCKEIPKQPGFRTCYDCTVYKVRRAAGSLDGGW